MNTEMRFLKTALSLIHSSRNIKMSVNTVLRLLSENYGARYPSLFLKDMVTGHFTLEVSPEIAPDQKSDISQQINEWPLLSSLNVSGVVILSPDDLAASGNPFTEFARVSDTSAHFVMLAVEEPTRSLPAAFLTCYLPATPDFGRAIEVMRLFTKMLFFPLSNYGYRLTWDESNERGNATNALDGIIGQSTPMREVADLVRRIAASRASVLITGESGTGKELIARAIHDLSIRSSCQFVAVNCAALSHTVIESELFGHEKGAFTGAVSRRIGRFEKANGGTLFLDEIGEVSPEFQSKLLRVLQEGEFERVGSNETIKVDVRILCATNINLAEAVSKRIFREDLYYRINVVNIALPPLRDRGEDISLLAQHFMNQLNQEQSPNNVVKIRPHDFALLRNQPWYGNVRELQNAVHRAYLEQQDGWARFHFVRPLRGEFASLVAVMPETEVHHPDDDVAYEREKIEQALQRARGIQTEAARVLGITVRQLRYRIAKYQMSVRKF
ncbi:sigma-54 interaction domain-containing protein [Chrysiogenes arsenatis]|uniref:sigma-54 interaction domain-containing protein n=1 Tax=Chrysiogenes arsenatis TaxID=309797 RepID=UPI00040E10D4|nr:sigma 54-interacting transcriptional regulator [Chrysiogenes arsenatis]